MDNNMKFSKYSRNIRIANIVLRESDFFKTLASGKSSIQIDYKNIMTLGEYTGKEEQGGSLSKVYRIPIEWTNKKDGKVQKIDAIFDDYGNLLTTLPYSTTRLDEPITSGFEFSMAPGYKQRCQELENFLKAKYSKEAVDEIMKVAKSSSFEEMIKNLEEGDGLIPLDEVAIERIARRKDNFSNKEGYNPEDLNQELKSSQEEAIETQKAQEVVQQQNAFDMEQTQEKEEQQEQQEEVPIMQEATQTEKNPSEEQSQEQEVEQDNEVAPNTSEVEKSKVAKAIVASGVSPEQVQDVIFIPHPLEFNELLSGEYLLNNHQELVLIKLKGGREPSRFVFVQGDEDNYQMVETRGRYDEELRDLFPDKSAIGANAYTINDYDDDKKDSLEATFECDGKAQKISLVDVPISQRMDIVEKATMMAIIEKIKEKSDMEIAQAKLIEDPVERETQLAQIHKRQNQALLEAYIPGDDDYKIILANDEEIKEHLRAADEAEREKAAEEEAKKKAEEQAELEAQQAEEQNQEAENTGPSAAAIATAAIGGAALAGAALEDATLSNNNLSEEEMNKLLGDVGKPSHLDKLPYDGNEYPELGKTDPRRPY